MKKKISLVLAALLTLSISTTAMAAPSPTAQDTRILAEAVTIGSEVGTTGELPLDTITSANNELRNIFLQLVAEANNVSNAAFDENGELVLGDGGTPLASADESRLLAAFSFSPAKSVLDSISKNGSASVEFSVASVKAGDTIKILHYLEDKNTWEAIDATAVENGKVTASFTSLEDNATIVITELPTALASAPVVEPTSGRSLLGLYLSLGALLLALIAGGTVYGVKKSKKN